MRNRIAKARRKKQLTLRQLSQQVSVAMSTLSQYETGKRQPRIEMWIKLAKALDVSVPYLQGFMPNDLINSADDYKLDVKQALNNVLEQTTTEEPLLHNDLSNMISATLNISDMPDKIRLPFAVWSKMFLQLSKKDEMTDTQLQEFTSLTTELINLVYENKQLNN